MDPDDVIEEQNMISDPDVLDLAQRIHMVHEPAFTAEFPLKCFQSIRIKVSNLRFQEL